MTRGNRGIFLETFLLHVLKGIKIFPPQIRRQNISSVTDLQPGASWWSIHDFSIVFKSYGLSGSSNQDRSLIVPLHRYFYTSSVLPLCPLRKSLSLRTVVSAKSYHFPSHYLCTDENHLHPVHQQPQKKAFSYYRRGLSELFNFFPASRIDPRSSL